MSRILLLAAAWLLASQQATASEQILSVGSRSMTDLAVEWRAWREGERFLLGGAIRSFHFGPMEEPEMRVRLLGSGGAELGTAIFLFSPPLLATGDASSFGIAIGIPRDAVPEKVELLFFYRITDDDESLDNFQGFETGLAAPESSDDPSTNR